MTESAKSKIFISYSRSDAAFVDDLAAGLDHYGGYEVLIDREGIGHGEDWRARLGRLILECDSMVFVLSPESISSEICAWEVEEATKLHRRIIPALWRPVDFNMAPPGLSALNAVPFTEGKIIRGLEMLVEALDTDMGWLREHTALSERATEWEQKGAPSELLLRGSALRGAQQLLTERPASAPEPMERLRKYLRSSEEEEARLLSNERARAKEMEAARDAAEAARVREGVAAKKLVRRTLTGLGVSLALLLLSLAAGGFAFFQREEARSQREQAIAEAERADGEAARASQEAERATTAAREAREQRDAALLTQSRFLARTAQEFRGRGDAGNALAFARSAMPKDLDAPERPFTIEPVQAIFDTWGELRELAALRHTGWPIQPIELPDGGLVTGSLDGKIWFWGKDGTHRLTVEAHKPDPSNPGGPESVLKGLLGLADGRLLSWGEDKVLKFWSAEGELLTEQPYQYIGRRVSELGDGRFADFLEGEIVIRSGDWSALFSLRPALESVYRLDLLPSGRFFARQGASKSGQLFEKNGEAGAVLEVDTGRILGVSELSDGRLVTRSEKDFRYWSAEGKPERFVENAFEVQINGAIVLPDDRLVVYGQDGFGADIWRTKIYSPNGDLLTTIKTPSTPSDGMLLSDGRLLLGTKSQTPSIWSAEGEPGPVLRSGDRGGGVLELSDGRLLTRNLDGSVRLWSPDGREVAVFLGHEGRAIWAEQLSDGRYLSLGNQDDTARLWSEDGLPRAEHDFDSGLMEVTVLQQGRAAIQLPDKISLLDGSGEVAATLDYRGGQVDGLVELTDGRLLIWFRGEGDNPETNLQLLTASGEIIAKLDPPEKGFASAVVTSVGAIATLDKEGGLHRLDVESGLFETISTAEHKYRWLEHLADGRVAAVTQDGLLVQIMTPDLEPTFDVQLPEAYFQELHSLAEGKLAVITLRRQLLLIGEQGAEVTLFDTKGPIKGFARLSNGRIVTVGFDSALRFWDTNGVELDADQSARYENLFQLEDGRVVFSTSQAAEIWSAEGERLRTLQLGELDGALGLPNGDVVVWSGGSAQLAIAYGNYEIALKGHRNQIGGITHLSDGRLLGWDEFGLVRIWPGSLGQAMEWADTAIERLKPLTLAERCDYYLETDEVCQHQLN